ncbi:hypothetical protein [Shimia sagamensis]|uniref:Capsule polysaccharide biosynthesis protein n=1 Tax=Shimia sagamensis TaxID=1566352 RepID=A0ABY1NVC7_9RHOB|nr:hypothetical protein [Shimia sagamensis]SMP17844.1 Capsule polysaccharide biosynthesis protein [Shimia sagamensis]
MAAKVVFHLPKQFHENYLELTHLALFHKIHALIVPRGGEVEVRRRHETLRSMERSDWSDRLESENLHVIENGMVQQDNALNTALAYLPPYFHLDPQGVLAESMAGDAKFSETEVNAVLANSKFRGLHDRLVKKRRSRYGPKDEVTEIPDGCIAVFLQGDNPHRQGTAYCDNETLLRTVAENAGGRTVVVKAHPVSKQLDDAQLILNLLQDGLPVEPTDANVHDILRQCSVTVSYNSAVAMEGFMHGKPAILFGKSDFHHVVETVCNPNDFPTALHAALVSQHDYAKYLHWYFSNYAVSVEDWLLEDKLLQIFEKMGFAEDRLGLREVSGATSENQVGPRSKQAIDETQRLFRGLTEAKSVKLRRSLIIDEDYHEFIGAIGDQKVRVCRHLSAEGQRDVRARVAETSYLQDIMVSEQFFAEKAIFAHEEYGVLCVSQVPGVPLAQKIAGASGPRRSKFVRMGAEWLEAATQARIKQTELASLFRLKNLKEWSLDNIEDDGDCSLLERLLSDLTKRARLIKGMEIKQIHGQAWFSAENLVFKDTTLCGINIRGAHWTSVSRAAAQYLVDLQLVAPAISGKTRFGIAQDDWRAFLSIDLVPEGERRTALPFFIGEQLFRRFVTDYRSQEKRERGRQSIRVFLE